MHAVKSIYFSVLILSTCILNGCSDTRRQVEQTVHPERRKSATKPPTTYTATVEISYPSAVFYSADSVQLENIKAVTDSGVFESIVHDCYYQMKNARHVLKEYYPAIKIVEVDKARYLLFKSARGDERIDLNEKNDPCGLLLYDGRKPARLVDMTNINSELRFYYMK
jgi:hypothetical protein